MKKNSLAANSRLKSCESVFFMIGQIAPHILERAEAMVDGEDPYTDDDDLDSMPYPGAEDTLPMGCVR